jgi:hypothetical protein
MSQHAHRPQLAVSTAVGGILAALSLFSATASADEWEISGTGNDILSVTGTAPWDQTIIETGQFEATDITPGDAYLGGISFSNALLTTTYALGVTNQELVGYDEFGSVPHHDVFDVLNFGNGFVNSYADYSAFGVNVTITDTLTTPFGNVDIPTSFDASALFDPPFTAAATDLLEPGAFTAALEADWASLVSLF